MAHGFTAVNAEGVNLAASRDIIAAKIQALQSMKSNSSYIKRLAALRDLRIALKPVVELLSEGLYDGESPHGISELYKKLSNQELAIIRQHTDEEDQEKAHILIERLGELANSRDNEEVHNALYDLLDNHQPKNAWEALIQVTAMSKVNLYACEDDKQINFFAFRTQDICTKFPNDHEVLAKALESYDDLKYKISYILPGDEYAAFTKFQLEVMRDNHNNAPGTPKSYASELVEIAYICSQTLSAPEDKNPELQKQLTELALELAKEPEAESLIIESLGAIDLRDSIPVDTSWIREIGKGLIESGRKLSESLIKAYSKHLAESAEIHNEYADQVGLPESIEEEITSLARLIPPQTMVDSDAQAVQLQIPQSVSKDKYTQDGMQILREIHNISGDFSRSM